MNSPNNSALIPQDLEDNFSIMKKGIDTLDKLIHVILYKLIQKITTSDEKV